MTQRFYTKLVTGELLYWSLFSKSTLTKSRIQKAIELLSVSSNKSGFNVKYNKALTREEGSSSNQVALIFKIVYGTAQPLKELNRVQEYIEREINLRKETTIVLTN